MKNPIITLLTDFGTKDHYVASMKGVIVGINPRCQLIDITHEVNPHDIREGAILLANAFSNFPKGTIHMAVIDPGVGGVRNSILLKTENYFFVGPDNGLFTLVARRDIVKQVIDLSHKKYFLPHISTTFHGRDIFAPVAGYLSLGMKPETFGEKLDHWVKLDLKEPEVRGQKLFGEILSIDHFGNLITNIDEKKLSYFIKKRPFIIHVGKEAIRGMKKGYWEGKRGELIALLDSSGFMEISIREGNALKRMKVKRGDPVLISVIRDR